MKRELVPNQVRSVGLASCGLVREVPPMTMTFRSPEKRPLARSITALAALLLTLAVTTVPAIASDDCGTNSFGFTETRLLNDGVSNAAGPFPADIPAGTYTVTLVSHDDHDDDSPSQTGEQYHVVLDSGYTSPVSTDIPDSASTMTSTFHGQRINASTTISVVHAGAPGINSVNVLCVGFTPQLDSSTQITREPEPADGVPQLPAGNLERDPVTEEGQDVPHLPAADVNREPEPAARTQPGNDPNFGPDFSTLPADTPDIPPSTTGVEIDTGVIETQVRGSVQTPDTPIAQLAITGPTLETIAILALGLALIVVGGLLVREEKRFG